MLSYYAKFAADKRAGGFVATFPDFGFGVTQGETEEQMIEMAQDLLKCLVQELIDRGSPLPSARRRRGKNFRPISLPAQQSAQAELYAAFEASRWTRVEFARRLGISKPKPERLFNLDYAAPLDQVENAFRALGKKLEVTVANAA